MVGDPTKVGKAASSMLMDEVSSTLKVLNEGAQPDAEEVNDEDAKGAADGNA